MSKQRFIASLGAWRSTPQVARKWLTNINNGLAKEVLVTTEIIINTGGTHTSINSAPKIITTCINRCAVQRGIEIGSTLSLVLIDITSAITVPLSPGTLSSSSLTVLYTHHNKSLRGVPRGTTPDTSRFTARVTTKVLLTSERLYNRHGISKGKELGLLQNLATKLTCFL